MSVYSHCCCQSVIVKTPENESSAVGSIYDPLEGGEEEAKWTWNLEEETDSAAVLFLSTSGNSVHSDLSIYQPLSIQI